MSKNYLIGSDKALEAILNGDNVFISGAAGSGKSTIIGTIKTFLGNSSIFVAPTGLAALNIEGVTAHKLLGLSFGVTEEADYNNLKSCKCKRLLKSKGLERIVIDEMSMLRMDKFIEISEKLKRIRNNTKPFGGLQVVVVGDCFQLPAIISMQERKAYYTFYHSPFCFDSELWQECNFTNVLLDTIHRQEDPVFANILNEIRLGQNLMVNLDKINQECFNRKLSQQATVLCATNAHANETNLKYYNKLPTKEVVFKSIIIGDFPDRPVDEVSRFKVGAKVIILVNDSDGQYVNGTTGLITSITLSAIYVDVGNKIVEVREKTWNNIKYTITKDFSGKDIILEERLGEYIAFPLKLAYAVTIHKSQGMTLNEAELNMGNGSFASGQTYVGLSRVRSIEGLKLTRPLTQKDIIVDKKIINFYNRTFGDI